MPKIQFVIIGLEVDSESVENSIQIQPDRPPRTNKSKRWTKQKPEDSNELNTPAADKTSAGVTNQKRTKASGMILKRNY